MQPTRTEAVKESGIMSFILSSFINCLQDVFESSELSPEDYFVEDDITQKLRELRDTGLTVITLLGKKDDIIVMAREEDDGISFTFKQTTVTKQLSVAHLLDIAVTAKRAIS